MSAHRNVQTPPHFDWPAVGGKRPVWTGDRFIVDGRSCSVLDYEAGESGWSDHLTLFHEAIAGDGQHPIDVASRRRARRALRTHLQGVATPVLLEVGCSSGFLLRELVGDWPGSLVMGADYIMEPLDRLARTLTTLPLLRFDMVKCPLPSESLDGVVLLNVIEHIEQDAAAVAQVGRVLKPGGVAVIEVPAGPHLYDVYDKYLHHYRRYQLDELCRLVERAGLAIAERSHLGFLVYPAFSFVKRRNRRALTAPADAQRAIVERNITSSGSGPFLRWATRVEEQVGKWVTFPVGIRCVVTAVRP
jgi:SAM-dependent methyltransferase